MYGDEVFEVVRVENKGANPEGLTVAEFEAMLTNVEREKGIRYRRPE
jgi:hypothetical protein